MGVSFPFTAVVGSGEFGVALCLAAIDPGLGGVLVRGEKGTAKTTMARALTGVLPAIQVIPGCRFSCDPVHFDPGCPDGPHRPDGEVREQSVPFVELPLGASEDRVLGSLHLDRLLAAGEIRFEPGLLARANRGVLYVDEVNLLPDHIVDSLLDAAATGRARVEREGASVEHAARFVLIGTMNPEEGELRPQLLDRFGLAVEVHASRDPRQRREVVRRRLGFERDAEALVDRFAEEEQALGARIATARRLLPDVELSEDLLDVIVGVCAELGIDGMRGDLVTARASVAHAAWCGRTHVTPEDVRAAARLALPHRLRRNPFDERGAQVHLDDLLHRHLEGGPPPGPEGGPDGGGGPGGDRSALTRRPGPARTDQNRARQNRAGEDRAGRNRPGAGARGRRVTATTPRGRHLRAVLPGDPGGRGFSLAETIRAALPHQPARGRVAGTALRLAPADARRSLRECPGGNLVVFVVDLSGSLGVTARVTQLKTAVTAVLLDAPRRRTRVAVITFGGAAARVLVPPTPSLERARRELADLPTGGRLPVAEALTLAADLVATARNRDAERRPLLVLLTDGRAQGAADRLTQQRIPAVVIDCGSHRQARPGPARHLDRYLGVGQVTAPQSAAAQAQTVA